MMTRNQLRLCVWVFITALPFCISIFFASWLIVLVVTLIGFVFGLGGFLEGVVRSAREEVVRRQKVFALLLKGENSSYLLTQEEIEQLGAGLSKPCINDRSKSYHQILKDDSATSDARKAFMRRCILMSDLMYSSKGCSLSSVALCFETKDKKIVADALLHPFTSSDGNGLRRETLLECFMEGKYNVIGEYWGENFSSNFGLRGLTVITVRDCLLFFAGSQEENPFLEHVFLENVLKKQAGVLLRYLSIYQELPLINPHFIEITSSIIERLGEKMLEKCSPNGPLRLGEKMLEKCSPNGPLLIHYLVQNKSLRVVWPFLERLGFNFVKKNLGNYDGSFYSGKVKAYVALFGKGVGSLRNRLLAEDYDSDLFSLSNAFVRSLLLERDDDQRSLFQKLCLQRPDVLTIAGSKIFHDIITKEDIFEEMVRDNFCGSIKNKVLNQRIIFQINFYFTTLKKEEEPNHVMELLIRCFSGELFHDDRYFQLNDRSGLNRFFKECYEKLAPLIEPKFGGYSFLEQFLCRDSFEGHSFLIDFWNERSDEEIKAELLAILSRQPAKYLDGLLKRKRAPTNIAARSRYLKRELSALDISSKRQSQREKHARVERFIKKDVKKLRIRRKSKGENGKKGQMEEVEVPFETVPIGSSVFAIIRKYADGLSTNTEVVSQGSPVFGRSYPASA